MQVKAANDFDNSPNGIKIDHVKKGEIIEVDEASVAGMVDAEQIEDPKGKDYAKDLDKQLNKKDGGDGEKSIGKMNKAELIAHAKEMFGVDLDGTKAEILGEVEALVAKAADEGGDD